MFSGIINNIGIIEYLDLEKKNEMKINSNFKKLIKIGESISCSGICLTVLKKKNKSFWVNISKETVMKTNISKLKLGNKINLEKSLAVGDDISGHLVFGHVDGVSKIEKIETNPESRVLTIRVPNNISKYMVSKCSISLDGISLTVNKVMKNLITINIIPFTWSNTTLVDCKEGDELNTEIDMLARYAFNAVKNLKK